jgi:DNA excision repair protein ERCC-2
MALDAIGKAIGHFFKQALRNSLVESAAPASIWPMQWDWPKRQLQISAGALARFDMIDYGTPGGAGLWRAEIGAKWHAALRKNAEAEAAEWQFEVGCEGRLHAAGWTFKVSGRMDHFLPGKSAILREVKTVNCSLPADPKDLRDRFRGHLMQVLIYQRLLQMKGQPTVADLLFVDIQTGELQGLPVRIEDQALLEQHLQTIANHLEERRAHFSRLRATRVGPAFASFRQGQEQASENLQQVTRRSPVTLFEAPTGFGKTGLALHAAMQQLADGSVDRILLLTAKNTGQQAYLKQLDQFRNDMPELACHVLRSRQDLHLEDLDERAFPPREIEARWRASGLSVPEMLGKGPLSLETLRSIAMRQFIPATVIQRFLLPYADVWVADFNYLFDPVVAATLQDIPTYLTQRTFLVIDEAHTLPERVATAYSHRFDATHVGNALTELQFARFPGRLTRLLDSLHAQLARLRPAPELDPVTEADLIGLMREIETALQDSRQELEDLSAASIELLWGIPHALRAWDHPRLSMLAFAPSKGALQLACLDAAPVIGETLQAFPRCLLMSATLQPWQALHEELGLSSGPPPASVLGHADWLTAAYSVLVDARADTRYRSRQDSSTLTARTIGATAENRNGPVAVFFPSYQYGELIRQRLEFLYPHLRISLPPRDLPLDQQSAFLEDALQHCDILLLVVGGRFTEGIDALGGVVRTAIMVGPALPELNPIQQARATLGPRQSAFERIYLIPGMRKVRQALGRLVRSPDHRARVLLHCQRFAEESTLGQLPGYLQPAGIIASDKELEELWLRPAPPV